MRRLRLILIGGILLWAACGSPDVDETAPELGAVVAVVDGEPIYARDFVLNYELGFPHLRRGDNPRLAYLQRVIDEKLLAAEGHRLGLGRTADIQRRLQDLREELLVEEVFERYVNDDITVSDDEIRGAAQKDRVSFKIRYLPLPTLDRALQARDEAVTVGLEQVVHEFASSQSDVSLRPEDLESPYLTWRDVNPALMSAIENLDVGDISQPVPYQGMYLLMQVLDVRREPVGPVVRDDERSRYEQVIFQRKARTRAREFIGSMMKPLDVRLKPGAYVTLRDNLWRWHQDAPPQQNLLRSLDLLEAPHADSIRSVLDDILITTNEGTWTVRQFLRDYPIERYPLRHQRAEDFESDLYDAVGLTLRDSAFVARAEEEGLDDQPQVRHELRLWSDKWVYRAMAEQIEEEGGSMEETLAGLRDRYDVEVHHDVLESLDLSSPDAPGMSLLKGHTMRPAFPVADVGR